MKIDFFTGPQCSLCELADALLQQTPKANSLAVTKRNVRNDSVLYHLYGARIPVLKRLDTSHELGWPFTAEELEAFLA